MTSSVRTTFRLAFVAALIAVLYLALMPAPDIVQIVSWQDKIEHAALFAALALLAVAGWPDHPLRIAIGLLLYGAAMELAQGQTGYRTADPWDWVADAIGLLVLIPVVLSRRRAAGQA
ncbi:MULTISPECIES: VanZ family protein [unclassified Thauera]|uniref:VanZ family protein n=1 Tax=unclassified Thauera TaxID=2609274 RepID=UPI0021E1733A|nr:VanZ family protein [Thauera sp. Sel9]MCV2216565.1 VanZ family protein [Thauera sp. Sel9]